MFVFTHLSVQDFWIKMVFLRDKLYGVWDCKVIHCAEGGLLVKAGPMLQVKEYFVYNSLVGHILMKPW